MSNPWVAAVAVIVIGALEGLAIQHGLDGTALAAAVGIIAGIAGFAVQKKPAA